MSIARFDDCLNGDLTLLSRSNELRQNARAELYWDGLRDEQRIEIRDALLQCEPFIKNDLRSNWIKKRPLANIIDDEAFINLIINQIINPGGF